MALKLNGEVPFPASGEGHFLCFTLADIAELEQKYGVGEYLQTIDQNLQEGSGGTLLDCLKAGLKMRDGNGNRVRVRFKVDDIGFPMTDAFEPVMDALCIAISNKTYAETIEAVIAQQAEIEKMTAEAAKKVEEDGPLKDSGESSDTKQSDTEQG